jgi:predicted nucleotidyltransferase
MIDKKQIQSELKFHLQNILNEHLQKIILYGSFARGDEKNESDIDFFVLTDLPDQEIRKIEKIITNISTELSLKYNIVISVILTNSLHYNKYLDILPFYKSISTDGIELYGK